MAKKADTKLNNDWQSIVAKPESKKTNKYEDEKPDSFHQKREDTYYTLFPSQDGEKYAFAIVPGANGLPFVMTDVMTIKRHRFTSPKSGIHYHENLKLPMDPNMLFDMSIIDKASDPNSLTEEDKEVIKGIKRHSDLVKRYKDLQYAKVIKKTGDKEVNLVNFGYAKVPKLFNQRLRKESVTAFFGIWTKWKGAPNTEREFGVKFITSRYGAFQDKFRSLLNQTSETHDEDVPDWFQKYFSTIGKVEGIMDIEMGSMGVGGKGASIKLVKLGKDVIDDKGVGVTGPIKESDILIPKEEDNKLSHLHYLMGYKSNEDLWQPTYVDRFEEAIIQLEDHVKSMQLELAAESGTSEGSDDKVEGNTSNGSKDSNDPKGDLPF